MMQFFSHMVQSASCTGFDSNVLASAITAFAALAGIWLRHWLESRKQATTKKEAKPRDRRDKRHSFIAEYIRTFWKFGS